GYIKVREAIGVVVSDSNPHSVAPSENASPFSDVGEGPVAIVPIQRIPQRLRRREEIAWPAVNEINVHPAIAVVVEKRATRASRLRQIFFCGSASDMGEGDTASGARHFRKGIYECLGGFREPRKTSRSRSRNCRAKELSATEKSCAPPCQ